MKTKTIYSHHAPKKHLNTPAKYVANKNVRLRLLEIRMPNYFAFDTIQPIARALVENRLIGGCCMTMEKIDDQFSALLIYDFYPVEDLTFAERLRHLFRKIITTVAGDQYFKVVLSIPFQVHL